jgi:3-(methylthio)propanoyl-CoA dehydrogenase
LARLEYDPQLSELLAKLGEGTQQLNAAIEFTKAQGNDYMDLYGRALVDVAIDLINGYLLCGQASTKAEMSVPIAGSGAGRNGQTIPMKQRKALLARRYIEKNVPKIQALTDLIRQGDQSTFSDYEALVGPVPES